MLGADPSQSGPRFTILSGDSRPHAPLEGPLRHLELRAMTKSQRMRDRAVVISSTMPSAKYSCSGSPLIFWNGSTAIDGLSGNASGGFVDVPIAGSERLDLSPSRMRWTRTGARCF